MLYSKLWISIASTIVLECFLYGIVNGDHVGSVKYNFISPSFSLLGARFKRGLDDDNDDAEEAFRIPSDVEVQNDTVDHQYYIMEVYTNRSDMMKDYYVDVVAMLEKPGTVVGNGTSKKRPAGVGEWILREIGANKLRKMLIVQRVTHGTHVECC
ncbi:unnamed protein product [Toxocara canis]|uniref:Secreted metalloprotease n=1 Tax=Toxocara canis TaxID=6265 RepID=A0A183V7Y2_TOXCA|nr:unnamed protein product [Toxocara canis]